jgi:RNA polymerase sigma-B factor
VASMEAAYAYRPVSLDGSLSHCHDGEQSPMSDRHGTTDDRYECINDGLTVVALVSELSERERAILAMRFEECLTQTQIAQRLGISQVHVSRLLGLILEHLRRRLDEDSATPMAARQSGDDHSPRLSMRHERETVYA